MWTRFAGSISITSSWKMLASIPVVSWSAWCLTADHPTDRVRMSMNIPLRFSRAASTAVAIIYDYKSALSNVHEEEKRAQVIKECHQRGADRLLALAFGNGGIYIKLGQHIGQLYHLLPEEYVRTMQENVLDRCPLTSYEDVRQTFIDELGHPPEQLFAYFDPKPIASASLAQVHVAYDREGRKLAVKVQHPKLKESSRADIAIVQALVYTIKSIFPSYDYSWLVREIKINLPKESNFLMELDNAERCRENLNSTNSRVQGRVHVPQMHLNLSSRRILTMEFIEGVNITDLDGLERMKINRKELAQLVSLTFNEMIFFFGMVHCDPHAANLLVRRNTSGKMELVLLDHGLYQEINADFRLEYASLWRALIFGDTNGIKTHSVAMNAGDLYPIFAAMLTYKEWDEITNQTTDHLQVGWSIVERKRRQKHAQQYAQQISTLLLRVPRELILLLKTNDCLRTIDKGLEQTTNTLTITARECTRALAGRKTSVLPRVVAYCVDVVHLELRLMMLKILTFYKKCSTLLFYALS